MTNTVKLKKRTLIDILFSAVKRNIGWVRFAVLLVIASAYGWYWSSLPNVEKIDEYPVNEEEQSKQEEVIETEDVVPYLWDMEIAFRSNLYPDVSQLPDMQQILHTSKLHKLFSELHYEESLPSDIIEHKEEVKVNKKDRDVRIAIVIDDMGGSPKRTKEIVALQAPITSSFLTFAPNLKTQIATAVSAGHEIMIHVPMQPKSNVYVSDDVLKVEMTHEQISTIFKNMLKKFDNVKGINNHMGSRFTENADKLEPVMKILSEKKLFFLDSKTTPKSQVEKQAIRYGVPYLHRHVFLDNNNDKEYILRQLRLTEKIARKNGYAIAIGHPKSQTSIALREWLATLPAKNIRVVHLSELLAK